MNLVESITGQQATEPAPADATPQAPPAIVVDTPPISAPPGTEPVTADAGQAQPANIAQLVDPPKPAKPLPINKGKGYRKLSDYYALDWTKNNTQLAQDAGVSRQRIAQIRAEIEAKQLAGEDTTADPQASTIASEIPGFESEPLPTDTPQPATEPAIAKAATDYKLLAETTFDMGTGLLCLTIGPEWKPRLLQVNGQTVDERALVCDALQKYYTAKQVQDLPPGVLLAFVLVSYSAPRFAEQNTSSKVKLAYNWAKVKLGNLFKRKKKPQQLEIVKHEAVK